MKQHVIIKFRKPLVDASSIPYSEDMIGDKSRARDSANPDVDSLMHEVALKFWLAHEYWPRAAGVELHEIREGLDRNWDCPEARNPMTTRPIRTSAQSRGARRAALTGAGGRDSRAARN